jgi:hypothetical protein
MGGEEKREWEYKGGGELYKGPCMQYGIITMNSFILLTYAYSKIKRSLQNKHNNKC